MTKPFASALRLLVIRRGSLCSDSWSGRELQGAVPTALADDEGMQRTLVSYHLQPLVAAGLVRSQKQGRDVVYSIDGDRLSQIALAFQKVALLRP